MKITACESPAGTSGLVRGVMLLFCLVFGGCQYDPHAHLLTLAEPSRQDVVGVYVNDQFDLPPELAGKSAEMMIELRADGTFSAKNAPPWQLDLPRAGFFESLMSGTGQWKIEKMGQVDPGAHPIWGVYLQNVPQRTSPVTTGEDPLQGRMAPAEFTGSKAPYGLIFEIGDPDSGYAILLKRKS